LKVVGVSTQATAPCSFAFALSWRSWRFAAAGSLAGSRRLGRAAGRSIGGSAVGGRRAAGRRAAAAASGGGGANVERC